MERGGAVRRGVEAWCDGRGGRCVGEERGLAGVARWGRGRVWELGGVRVVAGGAGDIGSGVGWGGSVEGVWVWVGEGKGKGEFTLARTGTRARGYGRLRGGAAWEVGVERSHFLSFLVGWSC